jgi:hypothetical protein
MTHLRLPSLVASLALLALAVASPAVAAPKTDAPTTTVAPVTAKPVVATQPKAKAKAKAKPKAKAAQIDPKLKTQILGDAPAPPTLTQTVNPEILRKAMKVPALSKAAKRELLVKGGLVVGESELDAPARLSVRDPVVDASTHVSLAGVVAHFPAEGADGVAHLEQAWAVPTGGINLFGFGGGGEQSIGIVGGQAILRFHAGASKHYIVDCAVAWEDELNFGTLVTEGTATTLAAATTTDGHVIALVPAKPSARTVSVTFFAGGGRWPLKSCEVTPAG